MPTKSLINVKPIISLASPFKDAGGMQEKAARGDGLKNLI